MAHAYKTLTKRPDDDISDEDDSSITSESSASLEQEDSPILDLPLDLRTRVLMLTSRGVSHRFASLSLSETLTHAAQASTSPRRPARPLAAHVQRHQTRHKILEQLQFRT